MSTYVALIQHTDKGISNTHRAATDIKDGIAVAERLGITIRNFYWTSGAYNAVLVLQAADKNGITSWSDSLQHLRVQLITAILDPDSMPQTTTGGWSSSSDTIHKWY